MSAAPASVPGFQTFHVALRVTNLAAVQDEVDITSYPSGPGIEYAIFDGTTRVVGQPISIGPGVTKTLDLEVRPSVAGNIHLACRSVNDPRASASALVQITPAGPQPVDHLVNVTAGRTVLDRRTGLFSGGVRISNISTTPIRAPLQLVVQNISNDTITVANSSGTTSDGKPFVDVSALLSDGVLDPGETVTARVLFRNPTGVRFTCQFGCRGTVGP